MHRAEDLGPRTGDDQRGTGADPDRRRCRATPRPDRRRAGAGRCSSSSIKVPGFRVPSHQPRGPAEAKPRPGACRCGLGGGKPTTDQFAINARGQDSKLSDGVRPGPAPVISSSADDGRQDQQLHGPHRDPVRRGRPGSVGANGPPPASAAPTTRPLVGEAPADDATATSLPRTTQPRGAAQAVGRRCWRLSIWAATTELPVTLVVSTSRAGLGSRRRSSRHRRCALLEMPS